VRRRHFGLNFLYKFAKNFNSLALTTANYRHCDFEVRLCSWDRKIGSPMQKFAKKFKCIFWASCGRKFFLKSRNILENINRNML